MTLRAIDGAVDAIGPSFASDIGFTGSISRCVKLGEGLDKVGDVDFVIIGEGMATAFWNFLRLLLSKGFRSVWDVCDLPTQLIPVWSPCNPRLEHPLSLTLDCEKNPNFKQYNLDVKISRDVIQKVPNSSKWMYGSDAGCRCGDQRVVELHQAFLRSDVVWTPEWDFISYHDAMALIRSLV